MFFITLRNKILEYAKDFYGAEPEYLWQSAPNYAVLRHKTNKKWYGIIMDIQRSKLGISGDEAVDILDIKCDPRLLGSFLQKDGYHPAYHMSKAKWLTVRLDGSVPFNEITGLIDMSYELTKGR